MITFISGEYPPNIGGVGDYTARLQSELEALGGQTAVITRRQVRRWDARALAFVVRHGPRYGAIHIQYQAGAFDLLGDVCLLPLMLRARPRLRVVTTFHDARAPYLFPKAGRLRGAAIRLLARTSDAVIAADERDLRTLGGPSRRFHQVPIGSNIAATPGDPIRDRLGFDPTDLVLVYFGLLNSSKGLDTLLSAFELVTAARPAARLMLLGGGVGASDPTDRGTAAEVTRRLARYGQRVVQPGYLEGNTLSMHLRSGDIAVLPYADGASPRRGSLLACAEHRLPIVSTLPASQAVADAVLAVPPGDAPALAQAVLRVANEPVEQARLRAGSAALAARCNWRTIAECHAAIYRELGCWPTH